MIIIMIFLNSIELSVTYKILKGNIKPLLEKIIFPFLYLTREESELFELDPVEFIRMEYGI